MKKVCQPDHTLPTGGRAVVAISVSNPELTFELHKGYKLKGEECSMIAGEGYPPLISVLTGLGKGSVSYEP